MWMIHECMHTPMCVHVCMKVLSLRGKIEPCLGRSCLVLLLLKKRETREWRQEVFNFYSCLTAPSNDFLVKLAKLCGSNLHCGKSFNYSGNPFTIRKLSFKIYPCCFKLYSNLFSSDDIVDKRFFSYNF